MKKQQKINQNKFPLYLDTGNRNGDNEKSKKESYFYKVHHDWRGGDCVYCTEE